ncbi:MAG TPA: 7TM diverse intracellular signaling domain-containing protein [Oligoflexus sp.]|uniref:7TM diverse intracellular signaling domain-containing protein n=1 Tax=Oligoflexus sp. TaxID=1971216 RepID=UPI002D6D605C|nr:7TM diverse intracellular signaling domain-containing protein [Oligoflexus sp.]HYX37525.1 7TM diverse intracellular signaling domain-containing protein [Oligoflexus sp.]
MLNDKIWLLDPEMPHISDKSREISGGTHPKEFLTQAQFRPGASEATWRITIQLNRKASLAILVPEFPFYELYLGERLLVTHGHAPDQPQRLYREVELGEGDHFPLTLKVKRHTDFWAPYTSFKLGLSSDISRRQQLTEFYGAFFLGLVLITALYHISLAIIIPQNKQSLYFAIFLVCLALRASLSDAEQILIRIQPDFSWEWSWKLGFIGYFVAPPSCLTFLNHLFPKTLPRFAVPLLWMTSAGMVIITLATDVATYAPLTDYFHLCTIFSLLISVIGFIQAYRLSMPGVKLLIGSLLVMIAAVMNDVVMVTYRVATTPLLDYAIITFIFSQTAIISYNYASAVRDIVHVHKQLQKLVYKHVVTQIARGRNLEDTMPIGGKEAVVLAFDVIGSSRIRHPQLNRTMERVMARCQEILHEGYDPETVSAPGYRIKEMGDGLLASIGFPLASTEQESNADTAVRIAVRFCKVFREEMAKLQYHEALHCCVGIAQGVIEGFFPKSGIKQYDVRGRPLMLATRYESMRNIVFKETGEYSSLIFIQDAVYKYLSVELQSDFKRWDCMQKGHRIRDDVHALQAWYRRLPGATSKPSHGQGSTVASSDSIGPGPRAVS